MKENKLNICIIGGGNISNTRHIPALKKLKNINIIGVISSSQKSIDKTCKNNKIKNSLLVNDPKNDIEKVKSCEWFKKVDAVVIGTPPNQHYQLIKMALLLKKNVLVEKPMVMNTKEADELIQLAKKEKLVFNVVHNFNFANGMKKICKIVENREYGELLAISEIQLTNRNRRLPSWYNELPLGLFYDEAAHFIYLLLRHGGDIKIDNAYAAYNKDKKDATPKTLSVDATAGKIPVHMYMNFNAPVCEWYYTLYFKDRIIYYDLFKDILIDLPTDKEHYAMDVLKNDLSRKHQYWWTFIKNGFRRVTNNLYYGHDYVLETFVNNVINKVDNKEKYITSEYGRKTVKAMNEIVEKVNKND